MSGLRQRLGISRFQADEHYKLALLAFGRRDLKRAQAEIQAAIDLLPRHAEYHAVHGLYLLEDKAPDRAQDAFERALALDAYDMLANYGGGMMAYRAKDWKTAARLFLMALAAKPSRPETQYFLAMAYHRLGQNAEAERWMDAARAGFADRDDRREKQSAGWIREFRKLGTVE